MFRDNLRQNGDISWVFELKGDFQQAIRHDQVALGLFIAAGLRHQQAQARGDWTRALAILDELNLPDSEQVRAKLADLTGPVTTGPVTTGGK